MQYQGDLLCYQGHYESCQRILKKCRSLREAKLGSEHYLLADTINSIGECHRIQKQYDLAGKSTFKEYYFNSPLSTI
jgi:hypothetical protein